MQGLKLKRKNRAKKEKTTTTTIIIFPGVVGAFSLIGWKSPSLTPYEGRYLCRKSMTLGFFLSFYKNVQWKIS